MLVRQCDICGHIIGNETGYMIDISETHMARNAEVRTKNLKMTIEICSMCKEVMFNALNERIPKQVNDDSKN